MCACVYGVCVWHVCTTCVRVYGASLCDAAIRSLEPCRHATMPCRTTMPCPMLCRHAMLRHAMPPCHAAMPCRHAIPPCHAAMPCHHAIPPCHAAMPYCLCRVAMPCRHATQRGGMQCCVLGMVGQRVEWGITTSHTDRAESGRCCIARWRGVHTFENPHSESYLRPPHSESYLRPPHSESAANSIPIKAAHGLQQKTADSRKYHPLLKE